jgi:hypothetical protein
LAQFFQWWGKTDMLNSSLSSFIKELSFQILAGQFGKQQITLDALCKDTVASTIEKLIRNVRLVFGYLRMTDNSRKIIFRDRS